MTLYSQTHGQGEDLVFIHGWGMNSSVWLETADRLSSDYRVTLLDLPGHGKSELEAGEYDLPFLTKSVLEVLPEKATLVGWSLGGMVALNLALQHPDRLKQLVLVASNPQFAKSESWPNAMDANVLAQFANGLEQDYEATVSRFLMLQARGGDNVKETVRILRERLKLHGMAQLEALRGGLNILRDASLVDQLESLSVSTRLMMGRLDALVPVRSLEDIASRIKDSKAHVFEHAAHAPFISHPDEFVDVLKAFLK